MLEKLEFMLALAREKHFRRAADSCGVAQPTLSLGIQSLEEILNVALVKRSSRFQGFTPEGERVLIWARRMVGDAHAMRQEIQALQRGIGAHLRLAAMPSAMSVVAALTAPFQTRHPGTRFIVLARPSDVVVSLLHNREVDAGITYIDHDPIDDVTRVPLFRETYLLLTSHGHPLNTAKSTTWADIASLPMCLLTRDLQHRRIIDSVFEGLHLETAPLVETDSAIALASHVATGRFVSVVPRSMLNALQPGDLHSLPIDTPTVTHTIGLVVSDRYAQPTSIRQLVEEARRLCPPELLAA